MKKQRGLSLVELMVAIVLGLILVAGVIELFVNNRQVYRVQEAKARMQEDGRYALQHIGKLMVNAGYRGCDSLLMQKANDLATNVDPDDGTTTTSFTSDQTLRPVTNVLNNSDAYLWRLDIPIEGHEGSSGSWSPALDGGINGAIAGSDVITIRTVGSVHANITSHDPSDFTAPIETGTDNSFTACNPDPDSPDYQETCSNIALVTTCDSAAIFQITNDPSSGTIEHSTGIGSPGNASADLGDNFGGGWLNTYSTYTFFIRQGAVGPSLYQKVLDNDAQELIQGVERMEILFGVDNNNDYSADAYQTANAVTNWANVISVRISLLMVSLENNLTVDGPQAYFFNGQNITPAADDRRLRRVFTQTFVLRNRTS